MRRFAPALSCTVLFALLITLVGCGGSNTPAANVVESVTVSPEIVSLNKGDVFQITATALDKNGTTVLSDFTYTTSDKTIADVSTGGLICAGTWDDVTKPVVCKSSSAVGAVNITVTAKGKSTVAKTYVHERVDSVRIAPVADCTSMAGTVQLTAKAFSSDKKVCDGLGAAVPCELPASTLGNFTWNSNDTDVVTVDNTAAKSGTATAGIPGQASIFASLSANNSPSTSFTTCPIVSIDIKATTDSTTTPFSLDSAGTKGLTAVAVDSKGVTLASPPLAWYSSQNHAMSVSPASPAVTATATAAAPGKTALQAICSSPTCNRRLNPVFSNVMMGTTNGTAVYTVYAASKSSTQLVLIDASSSNAVSTTTVVLPRTPNSMVVDRQGTKILFGADSGGAMLVDIAAGTVTSLGFPGRAIQFSPIGSAFALFDSTNSFIYIVEPSKLTISAVIPATGTTMRGDFSVEGTRGYFANGTSKLFFFDPILGPLSTTLPAPVQDAAILGSGQAVYLAGGAANAVSARGVCNINSGTIDTQAATAPTLVRALPDGSGALAVDSPNMLLINNVNVNNACPPVLTESSTPVNMNQGTFTATEMLVAPSGAKAAVFTDTNKVLLFDVATQTTTAVTVGATGTKAFPGGITLDSAFLWVASSDGKVHKIDLAAGTDVAQVDPALKKSATDSTAVTPDFVIIRNK